MIVIVDRKDDVVVQKVTKPDGSLVRYQYGVPGSATGMTGATTLTEARMAIGKGPHKSPEGTSVKNKENA